MKCKDREGNFLHENEKQDRFLKKLYGSFVGRILVSLLVRPWVSQAGGFLLNTPLSRLAVPGFVKEHGICLQEYEKQKFTSYNDFFKRRIKEQYRPIDQTPHHLIAPCDSKLSVYAIKEDARVQIKNTWYTMERLFHSQKIAKAYEGGQLLVFRLTVDDYHHYCYVDHGRKTRDFQIPGVFHTVNPVANDVYPIYKENEREFTLLHSENFGPILVMEVGALLVGRICNKNDYATKVLRGAEKGHFEFGGSTVILCLKKDAVRIDEDILINSRQGIETKVRMGEKIGQ